MLTSKRLYSIVFSKNAPLIEPDAVSMNLNLHLKQMLCKGCVDKTTKKKFSAELNIRYDDAAAEILRHLWNVSSSPTSLLSDYERCLAGVSTAQLPGWAQTLESAPGNYVEPQQYDWQGAAAGAATPEALRDLVSLANARQKARDAARASQRAAVAAASAALEALDKAATAEATLLVPLREELRKQEKGEKRKRLLMQMEEAARQKEESEARAAELEATARAKRAAAAALAEEVGAAA